MERFKDTYLKNGYVADRFFDAFDEDWVYEYLAERFRQDLLIQVIEKDVLPEGFSRLGILDLDKEKIIVSNDVVAPTKYSIEPDYNPIEIMFANFDRMESGDMSAYEYVPVAVPGVPVNKFYNGDEDKVLDSVMISKGYKILDPSPSQSKICDHTNSVDYSDDLQGKYFDRFALKIDSPLAYSDKAEVVAMQFNPFCPAAAKLIQTLVWETEKVVSGTYKYRGKVMAYRYDLDSVMFRYHADTWMKFLGLSVKDQNFYQMFDLVCHKRFFEMEPVVRNTCFLRNRLAILVEPFSTDRKSYLNYSVIGPWVGSVFRGVKGEDFFVPYLTPRVKIKGLCDDAAVSRFSVVSRYVVYRDEIHDQEKDIRLKRIKGRVFSDDYFFRLNKEDSLLMRRDKDGLRYMYECNFRIPTQLMNYRSSIIDHPMTVKIIDFIRDVNKVLRDQSMHADKWASEVDESYCSLKMQSVVDLAQEEENVDDNPLLEFDERYETCLQYRRTKGRVRKPLNKTVQEKIVSAMKDQSCQQSYKREDFVAMKYRGEETRARLNKAIEDRKRLNQQKY